MGEPFKINHEINIGGFKNMSRFDRVGWGLNRYEIIKIYKKIDFFKIF